MLQGGQSHEVGLLGQDRRMDREDLFKLDPVSKNHLLGPPSEFILNPFTFTFSSSSSSSSFFVCSSPIVLYAVYHNKALSSWLLILASSLNFTLAVAVTSLLLFFSLSFTSLSFPFLLPSSLFALPSSFFLLPSSFLYPSFPSFPFLPFPSFPSLPLLCTLKPV